MQALQVYASTERQEVGPVGAHSSEEGAIHTHADMAQIRRTRRSHTHSRDAKSVHKLNEQPSPSHRTVTRRRKHSPGRGLFCWTAVEGHRLASASPSAEATTPCHVM